jgi:hypothetical protein
MSDPLTKQVGGTHYKKLAIQPIEYVMLNGLGFCEGNIVKYITRWKDKGGVDDLKKVIHYTEFLINEWNEKHQPQRAPQGSAAEPHREGPWFLPLQAAPRGA